MQGLWKMSTKKEIKWLWSIHAKYTPRLCLVSNRSFKNFRSTLLKCSVVRRESGKVKGSLTAEVEYRGRGGRGDLEQFFLDPMSWSSAGVGREVKDRNLSILLQDKSPVQGLYGEGGVWEKQMREGDAMGRKVYRDKGHLTSHLFIYLFICLFIYLFIAKASSGGE